MRQHINSRFDFVQYCLRALGAPVIRINITEEQIDDIVDSSQILEFPDYMCYEILNIFVRLIMENASDPRLQTNIPINQTIPEAQSRN